MADGCSPGDDDAMVPAFLSPSDESNGRDREDDDDPHGVWGMSEGSADEAVAAVIAVASSAAIRRRLSGVRRGRVARPLRRPGSEPCRRRNRERDFIAENSGILRDYFASTASLPSTGKLTSSGGSASLERQGQNTPEWHGGLLKSVLCSRRHAAQRRRRP